MEVAGLCEEFGVLPNAGGLLDQDPFWIGRLKLYRDVKTEIQRVEKQRRGRQS